MRDFEGGGAEPTSVVNNQVPREPGPPKKPPAQPQSEDQVLSKWAPGAEIMLEEDEDFGGGTDVASGMFSGEFNKTIAGLPITGYILGSPGQTHEDVPGAWKRGDEGIIPGDQRQGTAYDAVAEFYSWNEAELVRAQQALFAYGWYKGKSDPNVATYSDMGFFNAWRNVVTVAARSGKTIAEVLQMGDPKTGAKRVGGGGRRGGGAGRAPFQASVANPDDLRRVAQETAQDVLGEKVDAATAEKYVKLYQGMQIKAQRSAYAGAGTVVQAPDASTAAETFLTQQEPMKAGSKDIANAADVLMALFAGGM
jgi:hypothetical protein